MNIRKNILYFVSVICALLIIFYFIFDERLHLVTKLIIFAIIAIVAFIVIILFPMRNAQFSQKRPTYLLIPLGIAAVVFILILILKWNVLQGEKDSIPLPKLSATMGMSVKKETPTPAPVTPTIDLSTPSPTPSPEFSQETIDTFDAGYLEYVNGNYGLAFTLLHKAAEDGYPKAELYVAFCYQEGKGVTENSFKAFKWFSRAAEQGLDTAQYNVGYCYHTAYGVRGDDVLAFEWFKKAADQNYELGLLWTGYCYHYGKGVKQDYDLAEKYYSAAIDLGNNNARDRMDQLLRDKN